MYAFVHIDKTAGTTLNSILRRSLGSRHCDIRLPLAKRRHDGRDHRALVEANDLRRVRRLYRNLRGIAGHNVKAYSNLADAFPEIRFITALRDPVARYRSHFLNRSRGHARVDFERWCAETWLHNWQTRMLAGEPSADRAIELLESRFGFVGLTERFDESLLLLADWLREPGFSTAYRRENELKDKCRPHDVARARIDISYLKTEDALGRMRAANVEDQKVYDYVVATIYPRQLAAYRGDLGAALAAFQCRQQTVRPSAEPLWGRLLRNYIYKPLLHCRAV